ncbi:MAG: CPBP family glutamic-type intramembrane protease [Bacilli bacterium]|nr:CPBP family glutamic-type intramembrane protease [Bacilli bacterium]
MKKFHKCPECRNEYDAFLSNCPTCNARNKTFPLEPRFERMIFLSDYKEVVLFVAGFFGYFLFSYLMQLGLSTLRFDDILKSAIQNLVAYGVVYGITLSILWTDFGLIIQGARKWRTIIAGLIGCAVTIGFCFAYQGILLAANVGFVPDSNRTMILAIIRNQPIMAFFIFALFEPIAEEFTYRLGLFTVVRKRNRIFAYIAPILVYTLIRVQFMGSNPINECLNIPIHLVPAFLYCYLYEHEGFSASVYAHVLVNLVTFALALTIQ